MSITERLGLEEVYFNGTQPLPGGVAQGSVSVFVYDNKTGIGINNAQINWTFNGRIFLESTDNTGKVTLFFPSERNFTVFVTAAGYQDNSWQELAITPLPLGVTIPLNPLQVQETRAKSQTPEDINVTPPEVILHSRLEIFFSNPFGFDLNRAVLLLQNDLLKVITDAIGGIAGVELTEMKTVTNNQLWITFKHNPPHLAAIIIGLVLVIVPILVIFVYNHFILRELETARLEAQGKASDAQIAEAYTAAKAEAKTPEDKQAVDKVFDKIIGDPADPNQPPGDGGLFGDILPTITGFLPIILLLAVVSGVTSVIPRRRRD